jgi:hypothetical protein
MFEEKDIVSISYDDLVRNTSLDDSGVESLLIDSIAEAFGASGLGIIAIRDVPNFQALRSRLLPLSQRLATLSNDQLDQITVPESIYQVGWSYGKEKLEGQLDMVLYNLRNIIRPHVRRRCSHDDFYLSLTLF